MRRKPFKIKRKINTKLLQLLHEPAQTMRLKRSMGVRYDRLREVRQVC